MAQRHQQSDCNNKENVRKDGLEGVPTLAADPGLSGSIELELLSAYIRLKGQKSVCGFVGFVGPNRLDLTRSLALIEHRGPDYQGINYSRVNDTQVGLAHARLSILDLSDSANQPFENHDSSIRLVFNGEIYNHYIIRRKLQKLGRNFLTTSDTEAVMQLYEQYGASCFKYLNGIFSIALVDLRKNRLILARDHFGAKPLFYSHSSNQTFGFSSEVPALRDLLQKDFGIDEQFLGEFMANGFLYEPCTGRKDLKKVTPGHYVTLSFEDFSKREVHFYEPKLFDQRESSLSEILREEVGMQCLADVKVGIFLSGGIDSTIIAANTPSSVKGLFAEYQPKNLDSKYVDIIAQRLGVNLIKVTLENESTNLNPLDDFQLVAEGMDELNSNFTYVATRKLSAISRQHGFKVMLSGMGADEMFLGYPRHYIGRYWHILKYLRSKHHLIENVLHRINYMERKVDRLTSFISADHFIDAYTSLVGYFSGPEICRLLETDRAWNLRFKERLYQLKAYDPNQGALFNMRSLDRLGYMSMNLAYTDRASMREGVEVRVPFLSPTIDQYCLTKGPKNGGKSELKKLLVPLLGKALVNRRKIGFNPPIKSKVDLLGLCGVRDVLEGGRLRSYMNMDIVRKILTAHFSGNRDESNKLNQLIFLTLWLDKN